MTLCIMISICLVLSSFGLGKSYMRVANAAGCNTNGGLISDLQTVVPQHLQIANAQQREVLRLSNGIANTGEGVWQMVPVVPADKNSPQKANQQFLDADGNIVATCTTGSSSVYHPAHKHFHISGVASFAVHSGNVDGPIIGKSLKVTSCLIDWVRLEGNSPDNERGYSSCDSGVQGISPGWVDQYHMALEGQSIDITGSPAGTYYLVSKSNPDGFFIDKTLKNNEAWVKFNLLRDSNGNPKIQITGHSACTDGLCGEDFPNR
jgi:hypothetical protein